MWGGYRGGLAVSAHPPPSNEVVSLLQPHSVISQTATLTSLRHQCACPAFNRPAEGNRPGFQMGCQSTGRPCGLRVGKAAGDGWVGGGGVFSGGGTGLQIRIIVWLF